MSVESVLAQATNLDGSRRFYPQYQHPATAQLREHIDALEALKKRSMPNVDLERALLYAREQQVRFERGEDRAKLEYLLLAGSPKEKQP